jgi:TRAP-type mannitol/chloroaromatic compound transport system substrate-binding protein
MKRRDFVTGAAGVVVGAAVTYAATSRAPTPMVPGTTDAPGAAPAVATGLHEWRMVTTWPKNFPGLGTGAQRIADRITAMSDGRLTVKLFAAGELVPAFEAFDAVREGTADMAHASSVYWVAKHKSAPFFATVPAGITQQEHTGWLHHAGGQALWDELYGGFGLKPFLAGATGCQMGGWFQKEITSLDDFNGLKMRIPGLGAEVINRLGATAVNMPGGEIMPALQSGVIDATEWVGPWNDLAFGFHKIAKFYYGPGFHEPNAALEAFVNKERFEALPSDLRLIVEGACLAESGYMLAEFTAGNNESQTVLVEEHGVKISRFPPAVVKAAYRAGLDVVSETASEGDIAKRIYDSWSTFRDKSIARAPYAENGFMNDRALASG